jgi:tetratricopeptide (TPR) repeat protein
VIVRQFGGVEAVLTGTAMLSTPGPHFDVSCTCTITERLGGASVADGTGAVIGIVTGVVFDADRATVELQVARADVIEERLGNSKLTPWSEWPERVAKMAKAQELAERANQFVLAGDIKGAEQLARSSMDEHFGHWLAWRTLGSIAYSRKDYGRAKHRYQRALEANPWNVEIAVSLALTMLNLGEYALVLDLCDRLIAGAAATAAVYGVRGMALEGLARPEEALKCYRVAVAMPDREEWMVTALLRLLRSQGKDREADEFEAQPRVNRPGT